MARLGLTCAIAGIIASPGHAQVIEIGEAGDATTYEAPTVFAEEGNAPVYETVIAAQPGSGRLSATVSVAQIEREYGLPPGIVDAVIYQESRGRMNAVSVKGALGLMQLMPETAAQLGVNPYIADQNIRGGARYLRQQIDRFGSIPLALAAYNAGPGAVLRYGGIPPYRETQNYVATILGRWRPPALAPVPVAKSVTTAVSVNPAETFFIEVINQ